jgi:hypothetical protein
MDDDMDNYLGQCLKNWSAQYQPPEDGRERLLRKASRPPVQQQRQIERFITSLINRYHYPEQYEYPGSNVILGPQSQSLAWTFQLAANTRMAN